MAGKLNFSLVAPEREIFAGSVDQVDAPGIEGDFGVLPGHAPFMTTLREGVDIDSVLSNSFGFGGTNATLVMSKYLG